MFVLLPNVPLHGAVDLVDVDGDLGLNVAWVIRLVRFDVSNPLHVIDVRIVPLIHAQGLDLGDVGAQLAMDGGASHAQKDAQAPTGPSWVPGAAISTGAVASDALDEVL